MTDDWDEIDGALKRVFSFSSYMEGFTFALKVSHIAESIDHHPDMLIQYQKVTLSTTTHEAGNVVTDKDRLLAQRINGIYDDFG